jgi:hypothetical protein
MGYPPDFITIKYLQDPLPVELSEYSATTNGEQVELSWTTATETNNKGFEIQRSTNGNTFKDIAFIQGNGTTTQKHLYSFSDNEVSIGNYSYRLKQIDFDGSYKYSNEIEVNVNSPLEFSLEQNYPNPFNPITGIRYIVKDRGLVSLKVYDILGTEIVSLVNEVKEPGVYSVSFNGLNYPSGVYLYKINVNNYVSVKKMLLVK